VGTADVAWTTTKAVAQEGVSNRARAPSPQVAAGGGQRVRRARDSTARAVPGGCLPGLAPRMAEDAPPGFSREELAEGAGQEHEEGQQPGFVLPGDTWGVESWLDERGHSLVPLSNPGFKLEMGLESSEHGTLLGR